MTSSFSAYTLNCVLPVVRVFVDPLTGTRHLQFLTVPNGYVKKYYYAETPLTGFAIALRGENGCTKTKHYFLC